LEAIIAKRKLIQFGRHKICRGDAKHYITIKRRNLDLATLDELSSDETFVDIAKCFAAVKTSSGVSIASGVSRFNDVNIDPRATHFFAVLSNETTRALETGNDFIEHKNRLYRILRTDNIDEIDRDVLIQCVERGAETLAAAEA
jgi:hypothetical protein